MWSLTVDCCVWWQLVKLQPAKVLVPLVSKITYMVVQKKRIPDTLDGCPLFWTTMYVECDVVLFSLRDMIWHFRDCLGH